MMDETPETPKARPERLPQPADAPVLPAETPPPEGPPPPPRAPVQAWLAYFGRMLRAVSWRRVAIYSGGGVAAMVLLLWLGINGVNTQPGRAWLVRLINGLTLPSGVRVHIGRIDGSIYADMTIHDITVSDPKGVFATSPQIHVDWRPFAYFRKHVDVRDLSSPLIAVWRLPQLELGNTQPPPPNQPLLPDLRIDLNRLQIDRVALSPGVAGPDARNLSLSGAAHILKGRAQIDALTASDKGDDVKVTLDAVPASDRFTLDSHIQAPGNGVIVNLLHLDKPFSAAIAGQGGWKNWLGGVSANLGQDNLTTLKVTGQDGTFHILGWARPDLLVGPNLIGNVGVLKPQVAIDTTLTLRARRSIDFEAALASPALAVKGTGIVDLGANRFSHLEVEAKLLRPETVDKSLSGQDVHADLKVDGAFDAPRIDYDVAARALKVGGLKLTGLQAEGRSHIDHGMITLPLKVRMASLTGLGDRVDELLTHVGADGDLRLHDGKLDSDNLRLRSDRVDARARLKGDMGAGVYVAAIDGRVDHYHLDPVGTLDLKTSVNLAWSGRGGLSVKGTATADSTHWDTDSLDKVLGGNAHLSAAYSVGRGVVTLAQLRGDAPDFKLLSGALTLKGNAITANAAAQSTQYGPLTASATGTFAKPVVVIHAPSPGLGAEIKDVVLNLTGQGGNSYALTAAGGSAYGPFSADTLLHLDKPLSVEVRKAHVAGVDMAGQLRQTPRGPLAGALSLNGSGLTGTASLNDVNGDQGAAIKAAGSNVAIPGVKATVGRTIIAATAVLRQQIELNADVQMAQLISGDTVVDAGRARIVMHGDKGTAQAVLHGEKEYPFDIAVNADIQPAVVTVAAQGKANTAAFRLTRPARLVKNGDEWDLNPTVVATDSGDVTLAGHIGSQTKLQMRFNHMDLQLANIFLPDAGVGGTADGALDFLQVGDRFPTARANLKIDNFTRSSVTTVSAPVSMVLDASLDPSRNPTGNYVRAVFRQGATDVGHLQLTVLPGGGPNTGNDWITQLMAAQISGGVRYNGPAGLPFSLTGLPRQSLAGALALAADISGRADAPQLTGMVRSDNLTYDNDSVGTRVTGISLEGRFSNDRLELTRFAGNAGSGTIKGSGWLSLAANQHFPMQVHIDLANARLANSDQINSTVSGTLDVVNNAAQGAVISGDLRLPSLRYVVIRQGAAEVNVLQGVHHKGYVLAQATTAGNGNAVPSKWKLDIRLRAPRRILVSGMGLDSEWSMDLHVAGTTDDPQVAGDMKIVRGRYSFAGRDFTIDNGTITFNGGALTDPQIALAASATLSDITGDITVTGSAQRPDIAFSSTPALPQDEVLSRMLFGTSVTNLSATEALQLASAVNGLRGGKDNLNPLGALRSATGIDRLSIVGADPTTGRGTSLAAGKYITNNVYAEIVTDTKGFTATQLAVALSRTLSVLSQTGGQNGTQVSVKYQKDY